LSKVLVFELLLSTARTYPNLSLILYWQVQVMWASEVKEGEAGGIEGERRERRSSLSKLVKGETPLSKHGRGNRLSSAIVNPNASTSNSSVLDPPIKPREIVAYDDIL